MLATVALAVPTMAACGDPERTVHYAGDWPFYESLDDLYGRADLVIEAKVEVHDGSREIFADDDADRRSGTGLVYSIFRVAVVQVFKGAAKTGDVIEVKQPGGVHDRVSYQAEQTTYLQVGTGYVLFLLLYGEVPASTLNPEQGQYELAADGSPMSLPGNPIELTMADLVSLAEHQDR